MAAISTLKAGAAAPATAASYETLPKELQLEILLTTLTINDPSPTEAVRRAGCLRLFSKATSDDFFQVCKDYVRATAAPTIKSQCDHYKEAPELNADELALAEQAHVEKMQELHGPYAMWDSENEFNPFAETDSHPLVCADPTCQRLVADSKRIGARSINNPASATAVADLAKMHEAFLKGEKYGYIYIKPSVAVLLAGEYPKDNAGAKPKYLEAVSGVDNFIRAATCGLPEAQRYWRYCTRTNKLDLLDTESSSPCTHAVEEEGYTYRILDLEKRHDTLRTYLKAWGEAPEFRHHVSVCCSGETFEPVVEQVVGEDGTLLPTCRVSNAVGDRCECASCPVRWRNDWPNDGSEDCDGDDDEGSGETAEKAEEGIWAVDEKIKKGLI